jgi:hypothetical protein
MALEEQKAQRAVMLVSGTSVDTKRRGTFRSSLGMTSSA